MALSSRKPLDVLIAEGSGEAPTVIEAEVRRQYGVRRLGELPRSRSASMRSASNAA